MRYVFIDFIISSFGIIVLDWYYFYWKRGYQSNHTHVSNIIKHMNSKLKEEADPLQTYKYLQKQLNTQHKRLLEQREQMLQRQNDRLVLYQKLDLVDFFKYSPSKSQNKQTIKYHLSQKFKDYMKKLTQNNIYKREGRLRNENKSGYEHESGIRRQLFAQRASNDHEHSISRNVQFNDRGNASSLQSRRMSNVQRNSELGRMFQTMRYYQGDKLSREFPQRNNRYYRCADDNNNDNIFQQHPRYCTQQPNGNSSKLNLQMQQLKGALGQQEKIYLLTQLNYYIKLYKQAQTKCRFMNKHLQNLHQFILEMKLNQHQQQYYKQQSYSNSHANHLSSSKSKSKSKSKHHTGYQQNIMLKQQNTMLRKQLQIYINELNAINAFTRQQQQLTPSLISNNINHNNSNNNNTLSPTFRKCSQARKVDCFREFAQHMSIMQQQLDNLISVVNSNNKESSSQSTTNQLIIDQLYAKISYLQSMIEKEQNEKVRFFQQVKKFKQLMNAKCQQITTLQNQLQTSQSLIDQLKHQQLQLYIQLNQQKSRKQNRIQLRTKLNQNQNQNQDISSFIKRTLNTNNPSQHMIETKHCREQSTVTTKPSTEFQFRNSRVQVNSKNTLTNNMNINQIPLWEQNKLSKQTYFTQEKSRTNYHKDNYYCQPNTVIRNSRSRSKHSARTESKDSYRSKSKTGYNDLYEPKPYQRYRKISNLNTIDTQSQSPHSPLLLYQRISSDNQQ